MAPVVAKGSEHSCDMLGGSGVITCKAELGVRPKLKMNTGMTRTLLITEDFKTLSTYSADTHLFLFS
jgi:hypothetical protein